nr:MAG TPA: hypothetical protein [Bacteriophage sp.]
MGILYSHKRFNAYALHYLKVLSIKLARDYHAFRFRLPRFCPDWY